MVCDSMPVFYTFNNIAINTVANQKFGFDIKSPLSIIQSNVFAFSAIEIDDTEIIEEETPDVDM